jgi:membrane protein required for colicin V production
MTGLDLAIFGVILISVLIGTVRGLIRESLSIVSWVAAIWLALAFCETAGGWFESWLENDALQIGAGFAVIFVVTLLIFSGVSYLIYKLIAVKAIKGTDRILGAMFGLLRAVFLVGAFVLVAQGLDVHVESWWQNSLLVSMFVPVADLLNELLPTAMSAADSALN